MSLILDHLFDSFFSLTLPLDICEMHDNKKNEGISVIQGMLLDGKNRGYKLYDSICLPLTQ